MSDNNLHLPRPGELWRHYKGGLYRVVCRAIDEESHETMVVYRSTANGRAWARSLSSWFEEVNGKPRFEKEPS